MKKLTLLSSIIFISSLGFSQSARIKTMEEQLDNQTITHPGLNEDLKVSVNDVTLHDFLSGIGRQHKINLTIAPDVDEVTVTNNFYDAKIKDVFLYLSKEYDLDIEFVGSVIIFKKYMAPVRQKAPPKKKVLEIEFDTITQFLSFDFKRDSLLNVAKAITKATNKNVVIAPSERDKVITSYIQNRPFENAIDKLAYANGLELEVTKDGFYLLKKRVIDVAIKKPTSTNNRVNRSNRQNPNNQSGFLEVYSDSGFIAVTAIDVPVNEVISSVLGEQNMSYVFYDKPTEVSSFYMNNVTPEEFLSYVLEGTQYTYKKTNGVYLIGQHNTDGLTYTRLVQLENRTIEAVEEFIDPKLKEGIYFKEYTDVNGFIISGSPLKIQQLEEAIKTIDVITPMITIEVMIVESVKSNSLSGGVTAGIGTTPNSNSSSGTIAPGVNIDLGTNAINSLLNSLNGFGVVNLGTVGPNFYLNIQALEVNQNLKIKSTPKISTLNGQEASLSIGATEYYLEVNNQVVNAGAGNQNLLQTQQYKPVSADLSIIIQPYVSSDEQVTLDIDVNQSNFTARISENAPPGSVSRKFKSIIRVKNGEMILLGGLEENTKNNSGSGLPFLARVPIIKWFFGKRIKEKSKTKLNVFIRPTVTY